MKKYYSTHPDDFKHYTTKEIREKYLIDNLFKDNEIVMNYSFDDRIIVASAVPTSGELEIAVVEELKSEYFLENREMGIINIGTAGYVLLDGEKYDLEHKDGIYVPKGTKSIKFGGNGARFYINSCPAHHEYPVHLIKHSDANPVKLGDENLGNVRTIFQYVHPAVCQSAQLCMGLTMLEPGNIWNTMPPHTHDRRMEVYLYFDIHNDGRVFHMMGEADETRHLVMKNEQVAISPSWSIHSGAGIGNYTFIWGMCGENQLFDDMDHIDIKNLK